MEEAIEAYKKAIKIKPDYATITIIWVMFLKIKASLDDAIEAYKKAISIKPDYAEALQ